MELITKIDGSIEVPRLMVENQAFDIFAKFSVSQRNPDAEAVNDSNISYYLGTNGSLITPSKNQRGARLSRLD